MKILSNFLILISFTVLVFIFWPVAKEEIKYQTNEIGLRYNIFYIGVGLVILAMALYRFFKRYKQSLLLRSKK